MFAILAFAAATTEEAQAVGLGELRVHSRLGEPLDVEVPLVAAPSAGMDPDCVRLAPKPPGIDDIPWLDRARFVVTGGAQPALRLSTTQAVHHPILMLGIRLACGFEVTREYTLLLEPAEIQVPVAAPEQPSPGRPEPIVRRAAAQLGGSWRTTEGDTLGGIAAQLHPGSRKVQRRFIAAVARANPDVFPDPRQAAKLPLAAGTVLAMPDFRVAPTAPATEPESPRRVRRAAPEPERRASAATGRHDRLSLSSEADPGPAAESGLRLAGSLDLARTRAATETQRELLRQEQRLLATLEDQIVQQLTLAERIRRIEEALATLKGGLRQIDRQIEAATAAPSAPEPAAAPAPISPAPAAAPTPARKQAPPGSGSVLPAERGPSPWRDWFLFGLLAAGVVATLVWLRARSRRPGTDELNMPGEQVEVPEPALLPDQALLPPEEPEPLPPPRQLPERPPSLPVAGAALGEEHAIDVAEHESAMELAEIMLSFGRVQGAAQTLADYVESNPRQAVQPWIKLLDIYRGAGMKAEFEALARRLNQTFNIELLTWEGRPRDSHPEEIETYPHIINRIQACWGQPECMEYLHHLLRDNRNGTRSGFPVEVLYEIMLLIGVLEEREVQQPPATPSSGPR